MPGIADRCAVCHRESPFSLLRCASCHKTVCSGCATRMTGSVFCGRECAHGFLYAGEDDEDSAGDGEEE